MTKEYKKTMDLELKKQVRLVNALGLHARAAAQIAALAQTAQNPIWILRDEQRVNASSVLDLLTLACPQGAIIEIYITDRRDLTILEQLAVLIESGFGEKQ